MLWSADRLQIWFKSDQNLVFTKRLLQQAVHPRSTPALGMMSQMHFLRSFSKDWIHTSLRLSKWAQMEFLSLYWQNKVLVKSCIHCASCKYLQSRIKPNLEHFQKRIAEIYRERCPQVKINSVILPMYIWYVVIFIVSTVVFFYILMAFTV